MKTNPFDKKRVYSIRKLVVGTCFVLVGVSILGAKNALAEETITTLSNPTVTVHKPIRTSVFPSQVEAEKDEAPIAKEEVRTTETPVKELPKTTTKTKDIVNLLGIAGLVASYGVVSHKKKEDKETELCKNKFVFSKIKK